MNKGLRNIITTVATTFVAMVVAVVFVIIPSGCSRKDEKTGAIYLTESYTVYPDSFVSSNLLISQRVDTLVVEDRGNDWNATLLKGQREGRIRMEGDDGLLVYLFNRATKPLTDEYDYLTPYEIYIGEGILNISGSTNIVDERIASGEIAEMSHGSYQWPVSMSDVSWGMAAAIVSSMSNSGVGEKTRAIALKNLVDRDISTVFEQESGLFCGITTEMQSKQLPTWADAGDAYEMMTLGGNVARLQAMQYINKVLPDSYDKTQIEKLKGNIAKSYWLPDKGMLSQTLYQKPYPEAVVATDNLAQSVAIVTHSVDEVMSQRIIQNTPMRESGVSITWPDFGVNERRRDLITKSMWAIAAAEVKNYAAWALNYGSLVGQSVKDEYALRLMQSVTLRTIIGLTPEAEGLRIQPFIHESLGEYHKVEGLKYRNSNLSIKISGTGDIISTFTIDGKVMPEAIIPKEIEGEHEIEIVLSGCSNVPNEVTMEQESKVIKGDTYRVHVNGAITEEINEEKYIPKEYTELTTIGLEKVGGKGSSVYASKNELYIPEGDSISIAFRSVATTGGRVLAKNSLASKHVESTRYKNSRIEFEYDTESGGEYYIRLRYLDGLGIVNKNRLYALRQLHVNGEFQGLIVLSQRGPEKWTHTESWTNMTGTTSPKSVTLNAGKNKIVVEYFAPNGGLNFNHDSNIVIPVSLEIIKR